MLVMCVRYTGKRGISGHHITGANPEDDLGRGRHQLCFLHCTRDGRRRYSHATVLWGPDDTHISSFMEHKFG